MSSQVTKPSWDADATSGPTRRSSGMFDWMKRIAKPDVPTSRSRAVLAKVQADQMSGNIMVSNSRLSLGKERSPSTINEPMKNVDPSNRIRGSCSPDHSADQENTSKLRNQSEDEVDQEKLSLGLVRGGPSSSLRFNEKHVAGSGSAPLESKVLTCLPSDKLNHGEGSGQVVAFEKQFSSDDFVCIGNGRCKYKKFSTLMLLEKKTNNNASHELQHSPSQAENFFPFFRKRGNLCPRCLSTDKPLPCSVHNVETMRICTMVDSMEARSHWPQKISQRAHQFQFTKETCVNLSKDQHSSREETLTAHVKEKTVGELVRSTPLINTSHPQEARIEPLQTDSDGAGTETGGTPLISKTDARNESSVQHGTTQIAPSPAKKDQGTDETDGRNTEKARSKRPIIEIPDTSAGSSTDSKEVTTSKVCSLNTKHLFPVGEHHSNSEFSPVQDPSRVNNDHNSRWIKRLRVISSNEYCIGTKGSDIGEPSSHKKYDEFLKIMMETPNIPTVNATDQNTDSPKSSENPLNSPIDDISNVEHSCPWVQRWCKDPEKIDPPVNSEPHSLESAVDQQGIPSIGAMALMVKTMNGLRSCEIKKKGPVFVWNTKKY